MINDIIANRFIELHSYILELEKDRYKKRLLDIFRNLSKEFIGKKIMPYKYCDPHYFYTYNDCDRLFDLIDFHIEFDISLQSSEWPKGYYIILEGCDDFFLYERMLDLFGCIDADL